MIERVILNVNDRVYSFLNPSMVTMKENPLHLVESGFHQCIINFMRNNFYPMGITAIMRD